MAQLSQKTRQLGLHLEQVQDFTPTPMTVSTETWYSGYHPYTLEEVFSAHTPADKQRQRQYFFDPAPSGDTTPSGRNSRASRNSAPTSHTPTHQSNRPFNPKAKANRKWKKQ